MPKVSFLLTRLTVMSACLAQQFDYRVVTEDRMKSQITWKGKSNRSGRFYSNENT
jgi:hypothetical protein